MQTRAKKILMLIAGWGFILFGVIGLFLPVLQGVLFLLVGLFILSSEYVWAHRLLVKIRNRFPSVAARWDEVTTSAHRWIDRFFHRTGERIG